MPCLCQVARVWDLVPRILLLKFEVGHQARRVWCEGKLGKEGATDFQTGLSWVRVYWGGKRWSGGWASYWDFAFSAAAAFCAIGFLPLGAAREFVLNIGQRGKLKLAKTANNLPVSFFLLVFCLLILGVGFSVPRFRCRCWDDHNWELAQWTHHLWYLEKSRLHSGTTDMKMVAHHV